MLELVLVSLLDAETLMAQVADRAVADARVRYESRLTGTKTELKHDIGDGRERLDERRVWRLEMAPDGVLQRLVERDGIPVAHAPTERPEFDLTTFLAGMRARYRFTMASPEPLNGCWAVAFHPKNPDGNAADSQEAVINHLSGVVYVDAERLHVRRIHGWLERPFSRGGVGRVQEAAVLFEQEIQRGVPLPQRSVFEVRYSKGFGIFFNSAVRVTITYAYDPLPEQTGTIAPSP